MPDRVDLQAKRLIRLFEEAEKGIAAEIRRISGIDLDDKLERRLATLQVMKKNTAKILKDLKAGGRQWCEDALPDIYSFAVQEARSDILNAGLKLVGGTGTIHRKAAEVLADKTFNRIADVVTTTGRKVQDIYAAASLDVSVKGGTLGYETWKQTRNRILDNLAGNGVIGFVDRAGKRWNMKSYGEMLARTTLMETHLEAKRQEFLAHEEDLVKVSSHPGACDLCIPWEGRVLSISGATEGYATLQQAKDAGLFHPNCRHTYGLWIPPER